MKYIDEEKIVEDFCTIKPPLPSNFCWYPFYNMQNAIANMIYAQGEEIKKIVSLAKDTTCISDINCLINKNIYQLTIFENSLLDNFKYCCSVYEKPLDPVCNCDIDGGFF